MSRTPYSFEIPCTNGGICEGKGFSTIKECVDQCKMMCKSLGVDYNDRDVKLFMTNADGKWEVTEEGELAS